MAPKKCICKVESKENLAGSVWLLRISLDFVADFVPGQYISLTVSQDGLRRSYSVASLPGVNYVDLLVDVSPMGVGSKYILGLNVGDDVEILGFLGHFVVDPMLVQNSKQVLFVATGTGVAPFKAMIIDLVENKRFEGDVRLVWGMRHEEDLYWLKEFESIRSDFGNFHFDVVLSKPQLEWSGLKGHVGDVLENISYYDGGVVAYLCGAPGMIDDVNNLLNKKGVSGDKIFFERYS